MNPTKEVQELIAYLLKEGIFLSSEFSDFSDNQLQDFLVFAKNKTKPLVLTKDLFSIPQIEQEDIVNLERERVSLEKGKKNDYFNVLQLLIEKHKKIYGQTPKIIQEQSPNIIQEQSPNKFPSLQPEPTQPQIQIITTYEGDSKKRTVSDFVAYFKNRYDSLKIILHNRPELQNIVSISHALTKKDKTTIMGLVFKKTVTKNNNIILELEDPTSAISCIINKEKMHSPEEINTINNIVEDEVIAVTGSIRRDALFVDEIITPNTVIKEKKYADQEVLAAFTADLHIGSKMFLEKEFENFLNWINLSSDFESPIDPYKIKYLFLVGDLVDGVGIYPEQDAELSISDIYAQYEKCAELLSQIRKDIKLIICPGNHDALRLSEPQPPLSKEFAKPLYALPNAVFLSNPSFLNIAQTQKFVGFDTLLYHGYSFDYFINTVNSIREKGGYNNPGAVTKFLLQKRHLAPTHQSTLHIPDTKTDPLVISRVPDLFVTAHIHKLGVSSYNNIISISCSCWQGKTTFQEKVGHEPDPCKLPVFNLKTRAVNILDFN